MNRPKPVAAPGYSMPSKNVLVTNVNGTGEDVVVFSALSAETLEKAYRETDVTFDEIYEVLDQELQFYIYEPCCLSEDEQASAEAMAEAISANIGCEFA